MAYEIQQYTLFYGWVNTWTYTDNAGEEQPEAFDTIEEAQAALDEYLADIQSEIDAGQRGVDEGYDPAEFRIRYVFLRPLSAAAGAA